MKFIVITKASLKPHDDVGNWADEIAAINDKEEEPCLYVGITDAPDLPKENLIPSTTPFVIEKNGCRFNVERIRTPVFEEGEILIVDETGREVAGRCRKPSKWLVEYEEFDDLAKAVKRAREIIFKEEGESR